MHKYSLRYFDAVNGCEYRQYFETDNLDDVLKKAELIARQWPSEIWKDGEMLCSIQSHAAGCDGASVH